MTVPPPDQAVLLAICAAPEADHGARLAAIPPHDWEPLAELAWGKRALPLLYRALARAGLLNALPPQVASRMEERARWHRLNALRQSAALARLCGRLEEAGMEPVALKGTRLAYRDYPEAWLRPMRDIDVLLPPAEAERAQALLVARDDYALAPWAGQYGLEHGHQLPELRDTLCETTIEVHHRLNARGWPHDARLTGMVRAQALAIEVSGSPVRVPSAAANLLHIVEHATLHHVFENGPLVLSDLHYIAADPTLDWAEVVAAAQDMGLLRSLCLTAAIAARHGAAWVPPELSAGVEAAAPHVAAASAALLEPDEGARQQAFLRRLERRSAGQPPGIAAALGRVLRPDPAVLAELAGTTAGNPRRWLGYPAWLVSRGSLFIAAIRNARARRGASAQVAMLDWLERG